MGLEIVISLKHHKTGIKVCRNLAPSCTSHITSPTYFSWSSSYLTPQPTPSHFIFQAHACPRVQTYFPTPVPGLSLFLETCAEDNLWERGLIYCGPSIPTFPLTSLGYFVSSFFFFFWSLLKILLLMCFLIYLSLPCSKTSEGRDVFLIHCCLSSTYIIVWHILIVW